MSICLIVVKKRWYILLLVVAECNGDQLLIFVASLPDCYLTSPCAYRYDPRNSVLEWSIILIDQSNRSGSMEFIVPPADPSTFFPISIGFAASNTFSDLKVTGIHPLKEGNPPKYSQRVRLVAANYQIV
uniref:Coatomer subunit delta n=1 Tax=Aegilops tauschii subsp. strangulata TaxID=200361 RepID=A0A452Z1N8_AEGTS